MTNLYPAKPAHWEPVPSYLHVGNLYLAAFATLTWGNLYPAANLDGGNLYTAYLHRGGKLYQANLYKCTCIVHTGEPVTSLPAHSGFLCLAEAVHLKRYCDEKFKG